MCVYGKFDGKFLYFFNLVGGISGISDGIHTFYGKPYNTIGNTRDR